MVIQQLKVTLFHSILIFKHCSIASGSKKDRGILTAINEYEFFSNKVELSFKSSSGTMKALEFDRQQ